MDYNNLTDQEVEARIAELERSSGKGGGGSGAAGSVPAASSSAPAKPYAELSDEEVEKRIAKLEAEAPAPVVQEMHPAFGDADRFVVKNFAADDNAALNYLQRKHPNLEVALDEKTGQIKARSKDGKEQAYRVLDPDQGIFKTLTSGAGLKEGLRDLGDIGYDALSGVGTSVATAAGGLAGVGAGGVGAIPTAMAAGGAASTGFEGLRQGLGSLLGIEDNFSGASLAGAGIGGAVSPLLLGTGGQVGSAMGKKILGAGMSDAAKLAAQKSQRGAAGLAWDNVGAPLARTAGAKIGSAFSGVGEEALRAVGDENKAFRQALKDPEGILKFIESAGDDVDAKFLAKKQDAYGRLQAALGEAADADVDLSSVKDRLKHAIREAEGQKAARKGTGGSSEILDSLKEAFEKHFVYDDTVKIPTQSMQPTGLLDASGQPVMRAVEGATEQTVRRELSTLTPQAAMELSSDLAELANLQAMKAGQVTGNRFAGATKAEKRLQMLGGDLKRELDSRIDAVVPEEAMPARQEYGQILGLEKAINDITKNPRQAFANLRNADKTSNLPNKQMMRRADRVIGTNLEKQSGMAEALETYAPGQKSFFSKLGSLKSIPAGAIGGVAGGLLAQQNEVSPWLGGVGGAMVGSALGGPAAVRRYIQGGLRVKNFSPMLKTGAGVEALQEQLSPWLQMGGNEK